MTRFAIFFMFVMLTISSVAVAEDPVNCPEGYICTISGGKSQIDSTTTVKSPPPSAIAPSINTSNSDSCTVGVAGAVQTQILGISAGKTVRDINCERLKNAKTLYDMGMKVAAVSVMCQDQRIFDAMMDAGTPCPYDGLIGAQAKEAWQNDPKRSKKTDEADPIFGDMTDDEKATAVGAGSIGLLALFLLLL